MGTRPPRGSLPLWGSRGPATSAISMAFLSPHLPRLESCSFLLPPTDSAALSWSETAEAVVSVPLLSLTRRFCSVLPAPGQEQLHSGSSVGEVGVWPRSAPGGDAGLGGAGNDGQVHPGPAGSRLPSMSECRGQEVACGLLTWGCPRRECMRDSAHEPGKQGRAVASLRGVDPNCKGRQRSC